ncbi:hypothetical protein EII17_03630 [Clostridiales bacterium COT073_COT-073]|nr:hypothetical protein EII17_03630 [Clostridiales bacterium COT073_COT-073]
MEQYDERNKTMPKKQIAAIDVGSHSIQMKVGEINRKGEFRELDHFYKTTTLGRDTFTTGKISFASVDKLCELLEVFSRVIKDYQITHYKAVATSALREAGNKDYIIDQVKQKTGIDITVLSNSEEQFYHHRAIKSRMPEIDKILAENTLMIALGAGSIQITAYHNQTLNSTQNIKIGALRLREVFGMLENELLDYQTVIEEYIKANLDAIDIFQEKLTYKNLIVVGGEIELLNRIQQKFLKNTEARLQIPDFDKLRQLLMSQSVVGLAEQYDVAYERAEILHPIMLLLDNVIKQVGTEQIILSEIGLNDGIIDELHEEIYSLTSKTTYAGDILENARELARRFYYHERHQKTLEDYASFLFQKTRRVHGMHEEELLLRTSIILQDVGKSIDQSNHAIHSYHIIKALEILGLSEREVNIIAQVAGYHTDSRPKFLDNDYRLLPQPDRILISKLTAIIGLANALDKSHQRKYELESVSLKNKDLVIRATTRFLSNTTLEEWSFKGKAEFFKEVFGVMPILKIKKEYK